MAVSYAGRAVVALVNSESAEQAARLAHRKSLAGCALHYGCEEALPKPYGLRGGVVPHRVVIDGNGTVLFNLDGLQGLGNLPKRMPEILQAAAASVQPAQRPPDPPAAEECAPLVLRVRDECYADDLPVRAGMGSWSEQQLRDYFLSGGQQQPATAEPTDSNRNDDGAEPKSRE